MSGDLFLLFRRKGVVPGLVDAISIVNTNRVFGFVLLPFDGQGIWYFPLFVQSIDVDGEGIFHAVEDKKIGPSVFSHNIAVRVNRRQINMQPRIETITERRLIGKRLKMSFAKNQTFKLWQSFMPRRKEIKNNLTADLFSLQLYPKSFDFTFSNLHEEFDKWAAIEVANFENIPDGMEAYTLPGGLYVVFDYKGLSTDTAVFEYIFGTWLPNSKNYSLDHRPHFEILGDKYKNNDPDSEEEIWIPVKLKG